MNPVSGIRGQITNHFNVVDPRHLFTTQELQSSGTPLELPLIACRTRWV